MTKLGQVVSTAEVEAEVRDVLQTWLHTYLGDFERTNGWPVYPEDGCIPRPRSWTQTTGPARDIPDRHIPRVVIRSPGISTYVRTGGEIAAWFVMGVAVVVRGQTAGHTRRLAQDYTATLRRLLVQLPGVSDLITAIELEAESAEVIETSREKTLAGGEVVISVLVEGVADPHGGPADSDIPTQPSQPPPDLGEWSTVEDVEVSVVNVPANEEIEP